MPMNNKAFGGEFVGEMDDDGVSGDGIYSGARKLVVNGHDHAFYAVRPPELVLNLPIILSHGGRRRVSQDSHHRYPPHTHWWLMYVNDDVCSS